MSAVSSPVYSYSKAIVNCALFKAALLIQLGECALLW